MTLTIDENFTTSDAIINAGKRTARVDFGIWIVAKLRENWNPANTDGDAPQIEFAENVKGIDFRNNDWVTIWTMDEISDPVTITYQFTNETLPAQIEVYTKGSRTHGQKVLAELRRILEGARKDTIEAAAGTNITGRTWMKVNNITHFGKTQKGYYRYIIDAELRWRFREVSV